MNQELITAQKLAEHLGLSVETIWRYTREGKIAALRIGTRQYRYDLNEVLQCLQSELPEGAATESKGKYTVGPYTYDDYASLPAEPSYTVQLIAGNFVKEPAPVLQHQRVSRRLLSILDEYLSQSNPQGELFNAPVDVVFSEHSTVQPDIVFVSNAAQLRNPEYIDVVPELIVEILSPASRRTDRMLKLDLYCQHGVLHYWLVDPEEGLIEAFKLANNNYTIVTIKDDEFEHPDFPGLKIDVAELVTKPI